MFVPTWVVWCVALFIACFPLSIMLMSNVDRSVGSSIEECNSGDTTMPVSGEDTLEVSELKELLLLQYVTALAGVQMSEYWGKDISRIG